MHFSDRDLKSKAFQALHSLESDLSGLAQFQKYVLDLCLLLLVLSFSICFHIVYL